ncbi:hypothetical protein NQ318_006353 [Aromia moschata]|uniref:Integrase catalytic domain-containing protein n=1 Tax=Aromia moschata TaxID=1265417 RepID=A0AAV8YJA5_9CUCU|nr:hypothetical protein NQ318_006353 [Aromia moschata]
MGLEDLRQVLQKNVLSLEIPDKNFKKCYVVSCKVNGFLCTGLIDTGYSAVTLRYTDARRFGVEWQRCNIQINGYGGGRSKAIGQCTINIEVDLVHARVPALIVADDIQDVSVMIGQPFINQTNVVLVVKDDQIRLFSSDILDLPQVDQLPPTKIKMMVTKDIVIPPHHIGHVKFNSVEQYEGDLFVDFQARYKPLNEYLIPSCVVSSKDGTLPILNVSTNFIRFTAKDTIARGMPCVPESSISAIFGTPRRIICDKGTCYSSKSFKEYTTKLNIKLTQNATATPRSNGQVERCNRTFLSGLTSTTDDESRWDQGIGRIKFGINSTLCKSTGKTPHELMFGYCPRGINDSFLSSEVGNSEYSTTLSERREQAKQNIERDQVKQKKRYDSKRLVDIKYQVGQQVLMKRNIGINDGKSRKLLPKYAGPFIITAVLDKDRYVVEDLPGTNRSQKKYSGICAVDKLQPFHIRNDSDDESSEEQNVGQRENVSQEENVPHQQTLLSGKTFPEGTLSSMSKRCSRGKRFPRGLCSSGANVAQRENVSQEENVPHEQTLLSGKTFPEETLSSGANVAQRENVSPEGSVPQEQTLLRGRTFPKRKTFLKSNALLRGKMFPKRTTILKGKTFPREDTFTRTLNRVAVADC